MFTELGDLSRVDLLAEVGPGDFVRIQVKCQRSVKGVVRVLSTKSGPGYKFRYRVGDVDLFAVYVYDRDVLLYIPAAVICERKSGSSFRLGPPRNGQRLFIRYASDFESFENAVAQVRSMPP